MIDVAAGDKIPRKGGPGERPFVFTNLKTGKGLDTIIAFIEKQGLLK